MGATPALKLPLYLAAGVTSVRSTGDEIVAATLVARIVREHPERAPRVFTCSPLIDGEPPIHRHIGRAVTDPAQVPALVDEMVGWGVTTLKICAGCERSVGSAVIEAGHRRRLVVTAHLGAYAAQDAVADGIDGLEHITSVANFLAPRLPQHDPPAGRPGDQRARRQRPRATSSAGVLAHLSPPLGLLVACGLSPAQALSAATLENARALQQSDHLGSIAEGKLADLVLLRANPLAAIRSSRSIELVVRGGIVCDPAALLRRVP